MKQKKKKGRKKEKKSNNRFVKRDILLRKNGAIY